jgi:hypothetical protein
MKTTLNRFLHTGLVGHILVDFLIAFVAGLAVLYIQRGI